MTKGWTEERRQKQAERIRQTRPWEKSTGPKSKGGKNRSKYNALKHGASSKKTLEMRTALKIQRDSITSLTKAMTQDPAFERALNELRKNRLESILKIAEKISTDQTDGDQSN